MNDDPKQPLTQDAPWLRIGPQLEKEWDSSKYRCPRDHAELEGGILLVEIEGVKLCVCMRCFANMLRCCEAVPREQEPDDKKTDQTAG